MEIKGTKGLISDAYSEKDSKSGNAGTPDLSVVGSGNELKNSQNFFRILDNGIRGEDGRNPENKRCGSITTLPSIYTFPAEGELESADEEKCEMNWKNIKGTGVN